METKRKTHTSTAVKQKWLDKNYIRFNVRVKPELDAQIREYLAQEGISRAEFLTRAINTLYPQADR